MSAYFSTCTTRAELKAEYRRLAMLHHPDRGGSIAHMQAINAEYERLFARLPRDGSDTAAGERDEDDGEEAGDFPAALQAIIHLPGLNIELIGNWLWVTGATYPVRDALKAAGFRWSKAKTAWYWHPEGYRKFGRRRYELDEIRTMHGSQVIQGRPYQAIG